MVFAADPDNATVQQTLRIHSLEQSLQTSTVQFSFVNKKTVIDTRTPPGGLGISISEGAIVGLSSGGNAETGGVLQVGDVIAAINGVSVQHQTHDGLVAMLKAQAVVELECIASSCTAANGRGSGSTVVSGDGSGGESTGAGARAASFGGLAATEVHRYLGFEITPQTPIVTTIVPGSPADQQGMQVGDLIVAIDSIPIRYDTPDEVVAAALQKAMPLFNLQLSRLEHGVAGRAGIKVGDAIVAVNGKPVIGLSRVEVMALFDHDNVGAVVGVGADGSTGGGEPAVVELTMLSRSTLVIPDMPTKKA
jgi:C-terminal processing protease CtpA/Prc